MGFEVFGQSLLSRMRTGVKRDNGNTPREQVPIFDNALAFTLFSKRIRPASARVSGASVSLGGVIENGPVVGAVGIAVGHPKLHPPLPDLVASPLDALEVRDARQALGVAEVVMVEPLALQPVTVDVQVVLHVWLDAVILHSTLQSLTTLEEPHEGFDVAELEV